MTMTSIPIIFKMDDDLRSVEDQRTEVSQMVAVMSLGMCTAIVAGSLSIEDAEKRLFNPQVLARLGTSN